MKSLNLPILSIYSAAEDCSTLSKIQSNHYDVVSNDLRNTIHIMSSIVIGRPNFTTTTKKLNIVDFIFGQLESVASSGCFSPSIFEISITNYHDTSMKEKTRGDCFMNT